MPLTSMTGFGRASGASGSASFEWELRSVNGRGLEARFRLPPGLETLEALLRPKLQARFSRGTINANLQLKRQAEAPSVTLNTELLERLYAGAAAFAAKRGLAPPGLDALLQARGVVDSGSADETPEARAALSADLAGAFDAALDALAAMRAAEGRALRAALAAHVQSIESLVARCEALREEFLPLIRARLEKQVSALFDGDSRIEPQRLHQEAALLAARADIREELDRLKAHAAAARSHLAADAPAGRKLDFLSQEFMREANTLCSKSPDTRLTEAGLELKNIIEQFREQVQNVE